MVYRAAFLSIAAAFFLGANFSIQTATFAQAESPSEPPLPAFPQGCEPLPVVRGTGSEVTKTTSPPGLPIPLPIGGASTRDNWNTDWVVPTNRTFRRFVVILMPRGNAKYQISMYLKYGDSTADKFYDNSSRLAANQPLVIEAAPRSTMQPYQVNVHVGGLESIGVRYSAAVAACS